MQLSGCVWILCTFVTAIAVEFSFTPAPNIGVNEFALYQCSVNHTKLPVRWQANGTLLPNANYANISINGTAQSSSTLTILGLSQYNNTVVRCYASGFLNGSNVPYNNYSESTLKIQGQLDAVKALSCQSYNPCIQCNWDPPFSLIPIPGYIVDITAINGGELVVTNTTVNTSWSYCPNHYGNYTISVAGNNTAGQGEVRTDTVNLPTVNINVTTFDYNKSNGDWLLRFSLTVGTSLNTASNYSVYARLTNKLSNIERQGTGNFQEDKFVGWVILNQLQDKVKWNLSLSLQHHRSGRFINTSVPIAFSTFGIRNCSPSNNSTGKICFTVEFVAGTSTTECLVTVNSSMTSYNHHVIIRSNDTAKCIPNLYAGNYIIKCYDGSSANSQNEAYLFNRYVPGLFESSSLASCTSPSPTSPLIVMPLPTIEQEEDGGLSFTEIITIIIIVVVIIAVLIVLTVLGKVPLRCKRKVKECDIKNKVNIVCLVLYNRYRLK